MNERYSRQVILPEFGLGKQEELKGASVLIIGAGGLGSPVILYLAAAGIGKIGIIEGDKVDISNLQRQILFKSDDIGQLKGLVALSEIKKLNPEIEVSVITEYLVKENALDVIQLYDVIVDGSDNFSTRYLVNDACVILNKPFVYGAIYKFEGQLSVFNFNNGPTYRCLFPEIPDSKDVPNCSEIGVLGVLPGVVGVLMATEVIKIITGLGEVLSGWLLTYDALTASFSKFGITKSYPDQEIKQLGNYIIDCSSSQSIENRILSIADIENGVLDSRVIQLIDVREPEEFNATNIASINLPLSKILVGDFVLPKDKSIVFFCKTGKRSSQAMNFLVSRGFQNVFSLSNSFNEIRSSDLKYKQ